MGAIKKRLQNLYWRTFPYYMLNVYRAYKAGKGVPVPSKLKTNTIRQYAKQYGTKTLIETGTYRGDTIAATIDVFERAYSIELSEELASKAQARFANDARVNILQGDSASELPKILEQVDSPALFWLDAHYSAGITSGGETGAPILKELETILAHPVKDHIILIDDAREFTGENGYPTIETVQELVLSGDPEIRLLAYNDIIRIWRPKHG